MKDIKDIMVEMDNMAKNQIAVDLSEEEKEELKSLINADFSAVKQSVSQECLPFCATPTPPPTQCPTCSPQSFCCVVTVPGDFTVDTGEVHAAVSPKNFTVIPGSQGTCTVTLGNGCTILLNSAKVSGCAEVFASLGVKDAQGNCTFICCSDCVCFCDQNVVCCGTITAAGIKFVVSNLEATQISAASAATCDQSIWRLTGTITLTC